MLLASGWMMPCKCNDFVGKVVLLRHKPVWYPRGQANPNVQSRQSSFPYILYSSQGKKNKGQGKRAVPRMTPARDLCLGTRAGVGAR